MPSLYVSCPQTDSGLALCFVIFATSVMASVSCLLGQARQLKGSDRGVPVSLDARRRSRGLMISGCFDQDEKFLRLDGTPTPINLATTMSTHP